MPIGNTERLVSCDEPWASAKGDFWVRRCYEDFLQRLGQFPEGFGVKIHTHVLMPNHYQLQVEVGSRPSLSAAMHCLNTGYGIWFNRRYRRHGALFQGRYKAILFDPEECPLAAHYYIHLNPVRVEILKGSKQRREQWTKHCCVSDVRGWVILSYENNSAQKRGMKGRILALDMTAS